MSQQFGSDAVQSLTAPTLVNGTPLQVVVGNFINPPFGNCKFKITASVFITFGTIPTTLRVQIFRNPSGENVSVFDSSAVAYGVAANALFNYVFQTTDAVPDGRPVQYGVTVTGAGTGTNDVANRAYVEATCLSG